MSDVRQGGVNEMFLGLILPVIQAPNGTPVSVLETVWAVLGFNLLGELCETSSIQSRPAEAEQLASGKVVIQGIRFYSGDREYLPPPVIGN